jgi:hypothetical protein
MSDYNPDKWMVVKITGNDSPPVYKVFACWAGGYLDGDSWKLNSGITTVKENTDYYFFGVLKNLVDKASANGITIEILSEDTDWMEITYE